MAERRKWMRVDRDCDGKGTRVKKTKVQPSFYCRRRIWQTSSILLHKGGRHNHGPSLEGRATCREKGTKECDRKKEKKLEVGPSPGKTAQGLPCPICDISQKKKRVRGIRLGAKAGRKNRESVLSIGGGRRKREGGVSVWEEKINDGSAGQDRITSMQSGQLGDRKRSGRRKDGD